MSSKEGQKMALRGHDLDHPGIGLPAWTKTLIEDVFMLKNQ